MVVRPVGSTDASQKIWSSMKSSLSGSFLIHTKHFKHPHVFYSKKGNWGENPWFRQILWDTLCFVEWAVEHFNSSGLNGEQTFTMLMGTPPPNIKSKISFWDTPVQTLVWQVTDTTICRNWIFFWKRDATLRLFYLTQVARTRRCLQLKCWARGGEGAVSRLHFCERVGKHPLVLWDKVQLHSLWTFKSSKPAHTRTHTVRQNNILPRKYFKANKKKKKETTPHMEKI